MSYVDDSLDRGEKVTYYGKLSKVWFVLWLIIGGVLCLVYGLGVLVLLWVCCKYFSTEIAVTNRRFIYKTGFIARRVNEVSLRKLEGVSLSQGIMGRLLQYGNVQVRGTGADRVLVKMAADPMTLRQQVNRAADEIVTQVNMLPPGISMPSEAKLKP